MLNLKISYDEDNTNNLFRLLIGVILMLSSIRGQLDADKFDLLLKLDPLRKNYYLDQSKLK